MNLFIIPLLTSVLIIIKCGGNCNTTDDLYPRVCVPDKVNNINVKVFNLR